MSNNKIYDLQLNNFFYFYIYLLIYLICNESIDSFAHYNAKKQFQCIVNISNLT